MRGRTPTASAAVMVLTLLLINSSSGVIFLPNERADGFLDKLPSALSEGVNQEIVREAQTVLIHLPPESGERGEDLLLEATVRNRPPPAMVVIHYRHQRGEPFFTREMEIVDDTSFTYKLPGYLLSDENVEYYLEVISATQVHAQSGTYFQPHRVDLISKTGKLSYLLLGSLLLAGVFMSLKMGLTRRKVSARKRPKVIEIGNKRKSSKKRVSAKVTR
ncbi:MAG: hypothetical protein ACE5JC_02380 [Candidatus Zixiibacteriota bacterium]